MADLVDIYAICDAVSGEIVYVGKAVDHQARFKSHMAVRKRRQTPLYRWLTKEIEAGRSPTIKVLKRCTLQDWPAVERAEIAKARSIGLARLNVARGGNEPYCSAEVRAQNGAKVARLRADTPKKARMHYLKCQLGRALKQGLVSERTKQKIRAAAVIHPEVFAGFLKHCAEV